MTPLALFCSIWLLAGAAHAEIAIGAAGAAKPPAAPVLPGVNWSEAIEKFSRESADTAPDPVDAALLEHRLQDAERAPASPPARAASAPALRASGAPAANNAALAATAVPPSPDKDAGEDWARSLRHTVWDIVKPYQDFIPGMGSAGRPPAEDSGDASVRVAQATTGPRYTPKTAEQRQIEQIRSDLLLSQLIDEITPWAGGIVGAGLLALALNQWLAYSKRRRRVKSGRRHSSKKRRHRSARRVDS
jgi:hypothetical protein